MVTGGPSFIGSHLVGRLLEQGRAIGAFDSFVIGRCSNLKQHNENPQLAVIESDGAAVAAATAGVERVFHLAARADMVLSRCPYALTKHPGEQPVMH